ncbi:tail fiber assembly protein [Xenorhabdus bovienii]|uniref:tail fiber assembly protein n=1 Tax=Xenorhabdus bovienii TaxID=40576 RepID=UPI0023B2F9B9|nr:tail fiber assembly protein [Xenorhabdus bovienii]MDE9566114.1 tail fiber assembly protein [Xenorhabdus bovienii]
MPIVYVNKQNPNWTYLLDTVAGRGLANIVEAVTVSQMQFDNLSDYQFIFSNGRAICIPKSPAPKEAHHWDGKKWVVDNAKLKHWQISEAEYQKQNLMTEARDKILPLQDAVDLGMATDSEQITLTAWKKYRVILNRIDCSTAPDIDWPKLPE